MTIRVPSDWKGRVDSQRVSQWLQEFSNLSYPLPEDPGAGDLRVNLSVPKRLVSAFTRKIRVRKGAALRRLIAANLTYSWVPQNDIADDPTSELAPQSLIRRQSIPVPAPRRQREVDAHPAKPWEHAGGLIYHDDLAISPVEQDRLFRQRHKKGVL